MDSAACSMIDSHHGYDVVKIERMQRYGPDRGKKIKYDAPKCNETYNNVMGQVDRLDQLRASKKGFGTLELTRKRHKWTDKFADVLKDLGNTVALTLYNEAGDGVETPVSHPEFIIQVHEDLLNAESWYSAASGGRRRSAAPAPVPNTSPTRPKRRQTRPGSTSRASKSTRGRRRRRTARRRFTTTPGRASHASFKTT